MKRSQILRLGSSHANVEKSKALKEARRENLQVHMIELNYGPKADFIRYLGELVGDLGDYIDGKPEEMLTVSVAPNNAISFRIAIPASEAKGLVSLLQEIQTVNQPLIDRPVSA